MNERRRDFIRRGCAILAALSVGGCVSGSGADCASTGSEALTVASFNMMFKSDVPNPDPQYFEYTKMTIRAWNARKDLLMPLLKYYDIDICGSQELRTPQLKYLFSKDGTYSYVDSTEGIKIWMKNVVIYKREKFDVLDSGMFWFTPTKSGGRYCQWVKFKNKSDDTTFFVFNLHNDHQKPDKRLIAANLMLQKIPEITQGAPFVLTGDFNAMKGSKEMAPYFASSIISDAKDISSTPPYGPKTSGSFSYEKRPVETRGTPIDFIFVSKDACVSKFAVHTDNFNDVYPSDHFPITARVEFNAKKSENK